MTYSHLIWFGSPDFVAVASVVIQSGPKPMCMSKWPKWAHVVVEAIFIGAFWSLHISLRRSTFVHSWTHSAQFVIAVSYLHSCQRSHFGEIKRFGNVGEQSVCRIARIFCPHNSLSPPTEIYHFVLLLDIYFYLCAFGGSVLCCAVLTRHHHHHHRCHRCRWRLFISTVGWFHSSLSPFIHFAQLKVGMRKHGENMCATQRYRNTVSACWKREREWRRRWRCCHSGSSSSSISQVENSLERTFAINIFRLCKVHRAKLNVGIGDILDSQLCALQVHRQVEHFFLLIGFYLVRVNELQARTTKLHTLSSRHLAIADGTVATTPPW